VDSYHGTLSTLFVIVNVSLKNICQDWLKISFDLYISKMIVKYHNQYGSILFILLRRQKFLYKDDWGIRLKSLIEKETDVISITIANRSNSTSDNERNSDRSSTGEHYTCRFSIEE
jgi:hypothetical protein